MYAALITIQKMKQRLQATTVWVEFGIKLFFDVKGEELKGINYKTYEVHTTITFHVNYANQKTSLKASMHIFSTNQNALSVSINGATLPAINTDKV